MKPEKPSPGVTRENRLSAEGLQRLEKHLRAGTAISRPVLAQWIKRYGDPAREIMKRYGIDTDVLDVLNQ